MIPENKMRTRKETTNTDNGKDVYNCKCTSRSGSLDIPNNEEEI